MTQLTEDQLAILAITANLYLRESSAITIAKQKLVHTLYEGDGGAKHSLSVAVQTKEDALNNTFLVTCLTCTAHIVIGFAEIDAAIKAVGDELPELVPLRDTLKLVLGDEMS